MPFDKTATPLPPQTIGVSEYDKPDPSYLDTVSAFLSNEGLIPSFLTSARRSVDDFNKVDQNYNVYDDVRRDGMEKYANRYLEVYNPTAYKAVSADIERENKNDKVLAASGWVPWTLGAVANVLTDPTMLLPGGALVKEAKLGYRAGQSALRIGGAAAAAAAVQEVGLQATQETRTKTESLVNIGGTALLGGIIGAAGAKFFTHGEWKAFGSRLKEELATEVPNPDKLTDIIVQRAQSAGAASVDDIKLDDLGVGGPKLAQAVANATAAARINPGIQTMLSPSKAVRETYARMVDNPIYTRMNMEGRSLGADVENSVKLYERGALSQWLRDSRSLYREAKDSGYRGTKTEFNEAIAKAGRRNDIDPSNDFVSNAARSAREKVFDPLLKRAQELRLLPEDVKVDTAASYVTRYWNRERLIGEEARFRKIATDYFRQEIARIPPGKRPDFVNKADLDDYVEETVTSVFNNLTGKHTADIPSWLVPVKRGPLKERVFRIPDELVEDFLHNDMEMILRRYTRTMGAEVELAAKFGRADMKDQFGAIAKEYEQLRKAAGGDAKKLEDLHRAEARDTTNLTAFRDMIRGTYRAGEEGSSWSKLTRAALAWNYMRLLGGVTLSSLNDASRLLGVHGLRATMTEALPTLVSNLRAVKISRADAHDLGAVAEAVLQSRLASLADLHNPYAAGSRFERFLSNTTNLFTKATGLSYWNDAMKTMASILTQNRILRNAAVKDFAKLNGRERAYMAYLGIDERMADRIAGQFEKYGVQEQKVYGANVAQWDDAEAVRAYAAALNKDIDRTIVTKGVADAPLWTKTNWGRLIMQFKSFGLASHQRVLISGLQESQHRFAEQLVFSTAIGMMIAYAKYAERGDFDQAERLLENPGMWIADGLDRSGILFLLTEPWNTVDKVREALGGKGGIGPSRIASIVAGDKDQAGGVSRFASRGPWGAVLGPWAGSFEDIGTIATQLSNADLKKSGANAIIRQIPGATLPGIRTAIHVGVKPHLQDAVE